MQETIKAQKIAVKMKKCIFDERNNAILDFPSFKKLQQLLNLISPICLPSLPLYSTPQHLMNSEMWEDQSDLKENPLCSETNYHLGNSSLLAFTGFLHNRESLCHLCTSFIWSFTWEEKRKIQGTKVEQEAKDEKGQGKKTEPIPFDHYKRNRMHQVALRLLSQPAHNGEILYSEDWILQPEEWLKMGDSLLLIGSQGIDYLKTIQLLCENEQELPESTLVESVYHQRRAAFHCLKKALAQSGKEGVTMLTTLLMTVGKQLVAINLYLI